MKIFVAILLSLPSYAFASSGDLRFSEGPKKGESVFPSEIGYYEMCFVGNPYAVRTKALRIMVDDIEKDEAFVRVDKNNDKLVLGYVSTKCLDDSLDATPDSCRTIWSVPRCK